MRTNLSVTVISLLLLVGVSAAAWEEGIVLTTDYSTYGGVSTFSRTEPWSISKDCALVHSDAVARYHGGLYYVVNRGGASNLQILDPDDGYSTVSQFSLGGGRNPQDIAFASDGTVWVSCYDTTELLRVDIGAGLVTGTVSTALFADADGLPETSWMLAVGDRLFINCQRLDRDNWWGPAGGSCLLVFDMIAGEWIDADAALPGVQGIDLTGENPTTQIELSADRSFLRVGCTGAYGMKDGGVEMIGLDDLTTRGLEMSEVDLDGDLLDFESAGDCCFVIISGSSYETSVRWYNRTTLELGVVDQSTGYVHADVAVFGGLLYVADRTVSAPGLRVFDAVTRLELTSSPLDTGLPPASIVLPIDEGVTAVPLAVAAGLRLDPPWPNPANPATTIRCRGEAGVRVPLAVYDPRGRLVRRSTVTLDGSGEATWRFNGLDMTGRAVAGGVYLVIAGEGGQRQMRKLTLVR